MPFDVVEHAINWIDNIYEIVCMIFTLQVKFKFYLTVCMQSTHTHKKQNRYATNESV